MRRKKYPRDKNNGKNGWVGGNPRYKRNGRKELLKHRTMRGLGKN